MRIPQGAGVRLGGATPDDPYLKVYGPDGVTLTDPVALLWTLRSEAGTVTTYNLGQSTKAGTGLYYVDVPAADVAALGHYQWYAKTTTPTGVLGGQEFDVVDPLAPALLTLADARSAIGKSVRGAAVDVDELQLHADVATEQIERMCRGDAVVPRTVVEAVTASGGRLRLSYGPNPTITGALDSAGNTVAVGTQWTVAGQTITAAAGYALTGSYTVTYRAGLTPIPASLKLAARILLQHLWKVQREQDPGGQPDGLDVVDTGYGFAVPNRVAELVRPWAKLPGVA